MKRLASLAAIAAILLTALLVAACNRPAQNRLQGYVEGEFVYVAAPLGGALESLFVRRGDQVKVGDQLFVLDSAAERAARDQARAALVMSEKDFARMEQLVRKNLVAMQELDHARSQRQNAPQAGLVYDTLFRIGEWVAPGRPIVALLPPNHVKVRAFVPETQIAKYRPGDSVRVTMDGGAQPFAGKISYISPKAEYTPPVIYSRETREKLVFMIEILFDPSVGAQLHPGQPVDVDLEART
jgi:HlyD family secretion protein